MHVLNIYAVHTQYIMKNRECYPIVLSSYKEYIAIMHIECRMHAECLPNTMPNACEMYAECTPNTYLFGLHSAKNRYRLHIRYT